MGSQRNTLYQSSATDFLPLVEIFAVELVLDWGQLFAVFIILLAIQIRSINMVRLLF